jgi:hypothetical protein
MEMLCWQILLGGVLAMAKLGFVVLPTMWLTMVTSSKPQPEPGQVWNDDLSIDELVSRIINALGFARDTLDNDDIPNPCCKLGDIVRAWNPTPSVWRCLYTSPLQFGHDMPPVSETDDTQIEDEDINEFRFRESEKVFNVAL